MSCHTRKYITLECISPRLVQCKPQTGVCKTGLVLIKFQPGVSKTRLDLFVSRLVSKDNIV